MLDWIGQLGGCPNHECLLVADAGTQWSVCLDISNKANKVFRRAKLIHTEQPVSGWPQGPNTMFFTAAKVMAERKQPFLLLESDAVPLKKHWLEEIEAAYKGGFMGCIYDCQDVGLVGQFMSGVAVYPDNAWSLLKDISQTAAWDVAGARIMLKFGAHTDLIQHFWGQRDLAPTFSETKSERSPINTFTRGNLLANACIFHRNKDGSLIRLLRNQMFPKQRNVIFAHGGDVGDLIYGLPVMKTVGPGTLVLHHHSVREPFTEAKVEKLAPLLRLQPYIEEVYFQHDRPDTKWDFNPFRERNWQVRSTKMESLAQSQFRIFKLEEGPIRDQWLWVDELTEIPGRPVVIHRSPRYHFARFPWLDILSKYKDQAAFIGMADEHANFCSEFRVNIPHYKTRDYLELARVIAGARLFIGNQSCPYAIAEGLKQNAILEALPGCDDCRFYRDNLQNNTSGAYVLPDL